MTPDPAKQMVQEVRTFIMVEVAAGRVVDPVWLRAHLIARHKNIEGIDVDWYLVHANENLRQVIGRVTREFHLDPDKHLKPDPQLTLPGFEHVQKAYSITRDGRLLIVPVDQLTTDEIREKCDELRAMGKGCYQHADELERYREERDSG